MQENCGKQQLMKKLLFIFILFTACLAHAQGKKEKQVIQRTYELSNTVFGTKDRQAIEDLFAREATYGHSGGKLETRAEAIAGITSNKSVYKDTVLSNMTVLMEDDVAIVRHIFQANEVNSEGKTSVLKLGLMLVWVKEKRKWRLMGRQAVRVM